MVYVEELVMLCTYIVLAKTLRLALENFDQKRKYVSKLNKYLIKELQIIPDVCC